MCKVKITILDVFIIHFLMNFLKAEQIFKINDIFFKNEETTIKVVNNTESCFRVLIKNPKSLSNYIQILINDPDKNVIPNNYIIVFYGEDSSFNNIKQVSNLISPKSNLYLNKNEIKKEFYFKAQNKYENRTFEIKIIPKSFCELNFNSSTISYLVTEENKNMNFIIKSDDNTKPIYFNHIVLWIYGNKDINVNLKLNESNYFKHTKYNTYIIKQGKNNDYFLSVSGTVGDLLDIGFILLNEYNWCKNCKEQNMELYKVFLKKNILNYMCFDIKNYKYHYINYFDDNNDIKHYTERNGKECFQLPEEKDEIFFSYHYLANKQKNNLDIYYLQLGHNYYFNIEENKTLGFLPLRLEEDYNYLKYYIRNLNSDLYNFKVYFGTCKNYPFCLNKKDIIKNENLIQNLGLFSYSLNKSEIKKIISPYRNNKNILFIEFIKGNHPWDYYISRNKISIMIYTDKTKAYINSYKNYKFIKKYDIDNINYELDKNAYHLYKDYDYFITIELISGDIAIDINNKNSIINNNSFYRYKNMYTYYLNKTNIKNYFNINISAKKNSIYNIYMDSFEYDDKIELYRLNVGGNFIFNIHPKKILKLYFYPRRIFTSYTQLDWEKIYSMFIVFYPINCDVEIKNQYRNDKLIHREIIDNNNNTSKNIIYYQEIGSTKEFTDVIPYEITLRNKFNNDKCLMYVSTYFFNTISLDSNDNSIILKENFPQKFILNQNFQKINFSYYFMENWKDIIININKTSIKNVDLQIVMNVNDIYFRKLKINLRQNIIPISNEELKNFIYENQINKIIFTIMLSNKTDEAIVNINIKSKEKNGHKEKNSDSKFYIIYLIIIFLAFILFCKFGLIKKNKMNKNNKVEGIELIDKE